MLRSMQYGIDLPNLGLGGDPATLAELAVEAERSGWDGFFVWDSLHVQSADPAVAATCDPWIALAAVAIATHRVRLGPMVCPVARRRPWKLARETVSLDHLSNGRLILPVALGAADDGGFCRVGEPLDRRARAERLDEGLAILDGLWSGRPFAHAGEHHRVDEMVFLPTPVQSRIPVWVVAAWPRPRSVARALRWGGMLPFKMEGAKNLSQEGWATAGGLEPDEVRCIVSRAPADRPYDVVLAGNTRAREAKDRDQVARYAEAGATWWLEARAWQSMWRHPGKISRVRDLISEGPPR